jgi:tetratricopeptide (TPR) repeat protein
MSPRLAQFAFLIAAVAVPCAALLFTAQIVLAEYPAPAPFVWRHVVLIHAVAASGAAWLIARAIVGRAIPRSGASVAAAVAVGVAVGVMSVWAAPWIATRLEANRAGFYVGAAVRILWTLALVFPWMAAAAAVRSRHGEIRTEPHWALTTVALLMAIILPTAYQRDLIVKHTRRLEELIAQARWHDASILSASLVAMRSEQPVHGKDPDSVSRLISRRVDELIQEISQPLPDQATPQQRSQRAVTLAGLGEYQHAIDFVSSDAGRNLASAMLLAALLQDQKQFEQSNRWYRLALQMAAGIKEPQARRENRRICYDALAYNARELREYREAEAIYHEAQQLEPADVPYFNLQLGKHYRLGGRPAMAVQHLELAADADPNLAPQAESQLRLLRHDTPGCFLGRPLAYPARR